jgi:ribonucleoside-diphosphate reductase alpha chain
LINFIIKRNGESAPFDAEKLNQWISWSCEGLFGVSWSDIVTKAIKAGYEGMRTEELQRCLIDASISMVELNTDYEKVAARLYLADLRKRVFGGFMPPSFQTFYDDMVRKGLWEDMGYDLIDLSQIANHIDHERDNKFPYSGLRQMGDKYLMRNKISGELYETPQFLYMGLAMASMRGEPLIDVLDFYDRLSMHKVNVPTPPLIGCRTPDKGFASCCLISGGDTADSIEAAGHIVYQMVKNRAGIGIEIETRGPNEPVKNGLVQHNGKLNYYKMIDALTKANTQESRGGSATMQYPFFDPEIETLLKLRNPKTVDKARIDTMDYSFAVNKFFWSSYLKDEKIALISPYYAPDTHREFYGKDIAVFSEAYNREVNKWKDEKVIRMQDGSFISPVKWIDASALVEIFADQRSDTARIYMHNIDETNRRSTYIDNVRQSNLCLEIVEPTSPYSHITDLYAEGDINPIFGNKVDGESALCNLGGVVINRIEDDVDYERTAYLLLKFIDNIIEMQTYPFPHMKYTSRNRRNAGVGMINLAHAMAQRGLSYASREGRQYMYDEAERMSFFLHKASIKLAEEKGACGWYHKTTYSNGVLPIDNMNRHISDYVDTSNKYNWGEIRADMFIHGMRNSVLEAYMPSESSSVTIGCTNGIEPARELMILKSSRQGDIPQIVPDYDELQYDYELAFTVPAREYLISMAVLQCHTGQSISTNVYYDLNNYEDRMVPLSEIAYDLLLFTKLGGKTLYYHNTAVNIGEACEGCSI